MSLPSLLKFPVVSINKIHRRCCRDCRRDRNFSISATLVAAVVLVATIAEECVYIYRHRRRNTFFDDSGDSSDGSDYMETGLYGLARKNVRQFAPRTIRPGQFPPKYLDNSPPISGQFPPNFRTIRPRRRKRQNHCI